MSKLVYGVGINDAGYIVRPTVNGIRENCPYYDRWVGMLTRVYSESFVKKYPTYKDVTVCEEWLTFSNFKAWMEKQDWEGKHLDKDLLIIGNKQYSPETCAFISPQLNSLLLDQRATRGLYPQGVRLQRGRFRVQCRNNGHEDNIGIYKTPEEASLAYKKYKSKVIKETVLRETDDPRLIKSLYDYADSLVMAS